jgi:hypothetical protein
MKINTKKATTVLTRWTHLFGTMVIAALMVQGVALSQTVNLGTAYSFAVLAGSGVTNTGPTVLKGDLGTFATLTISGFPPGTLALPGVNHAGDAVTQQAKSDLVTAYNDAAGRALTGTVSADLGGQTLVAGVYNSASSLGLTGTLTLNGEGDPNAVFIFQAGSTLITGSGSVVKLINSAQPCNVFWQVGSSATLGTTTSFVGSILALTSITLNTNATVIGRALARNGAVTLDNNTVIPPTCGAGGPCPEYIPPTGTITGINPGPPKQVLISVQDLESGLASITVVSAVNADMGIPVFTVGTTNAVIVTATKINQSQSATFALRVTDVCGNSTVVDPVYTALSAEVPQQFSLDANYPNPFNPTTRISFNITNAKGTTFVNVKIFDLLGREVKTLISEPMQSGQYSVEWDGTNEKGIDVPSGVYFYRMVAGDFVATRRMTLMK